MKRVCNNCGEPIADNTAFCRKCGTPVAESAPETSEQTPPEETQEKPAGEGAEKPSEGNPKTFKEMVMEKIGVWAAGAIGLLLFFWMIESCGGDPDIDSLEAEAKTLFVQICEENGFDTDAFTVKKVLLVESREGSGLYKGTVELSMKDGDVERAEIEVTCNNDRIFLEVKRLPPSLAGERFMQELFLRALLN